MYAMTPHGHKAPPPEIKGITVTTFSCRNGYFWFSLRGGKCVCVWGVYLVQGCTHCGGASCVICAGLGVPNWTQDADS